MSGSRTPGAICGAATSTGDRPFGWRLGEVNGHGRARELLPDPAEQKAIRTMRKMRAEGAASLAIRDAMRDQDFAVTHETVRKILVRGAAA